MPLQWRWALLLVVVVMAMVSRVAAFPIGKGRAGQARIAEAASCIRSRCAEAIVNGAPRHMHFSFLG